MATEGMPDLLVMGDSHTAALDMAIRDEGFSTSLLYINGNYWHAGGFVHDPVAGIALPRNRLVTRKIAQARQDMGGRLFHSDGVVVASIGYHLGRICPAIGRRGHTPDAQAFEVDPAASFLSTAMLEAVLTEQRAPLWDMLAKISAECVLVVVAPPILSDDRLSWQAAQFITRSLRERGVMVWDPRESGGALGRPIPDEMRMPDGVHGNLHYGRAVLDQLFPPTLADCA